MKLDFIKTGIAIGISGLISYGFLIFSSHADNYILSIGSLIFMILTLTLSMGTTFALPRTNLLIKTISAIFFVIALLSNLIFSFIDFKVATYFIINGILILGYILAVYSVERAKQ